MSVITVRKNVSNRGIIFDYDKHRNNSKKSNIYGNAGPVSRKYNMSKDLKDNVLVGRLLDTLVVGVIL